MRITIDSAESMDCIAEPSEHITVETQREFTSNGIKLYVHVNGRTILRIGQINPRNFNYVRT